jgi:death-on-curing family protein
VPSQSLNYLDYDDFHFVLFSSIEEQLNYDSSDPLPDYRKEKSEELRKILTFVQEDDYYPSLESKAAYLLTSIVQGHIYSNGNKRLGLITMFVFLITNGYWLKVKSGELTELCLYIADKERNKNATFDELKQFAEIFIKEHLEKV